jgi:phytoene dehydrogenase-like protein
MVPPDPATLNPKELMKLLFIGRRFQGMTSEDKYNQVQLMTMSAIDFLDQWFETDVLKATMSASGIIGTFLGVRSPGTAYVLLHHYMGEIDGAFRSWGFARGGTGAISNAIADAAREAGAEIRTKAPIAQIIVKNGKAKGVVLADGDVSRVFGQGEPGARRAAEFQGNTRSGGTSARRYFHFSQRGIHGARLRRCQVRQLLTASLY